MNRSTNTGKVELYLSLGSNLGDRRKNLEDAVSLLNVKFGTTFKRISGFIETEPWGFDSDEKFLNAVVVYDLNLPVGYNAEAEGLMILDACKEVERMLGRDIGAQYDDEGNRVYKSRPIDIDILLLGESRIDCEELTVPHKLMFDRDFVMIPLKEVIGEGIIIPEKF